MPRTVDEILRDAGVTVEELVREADRLGGNLDWRFRSTAQFLVGYHVTDPTERAALVSHMVEQRREVMAEFDYFECRECGFSSVQNANFRGSEYCPMCAEDNGRDVRMTRRPALDSDKPEGRDARKA